MRGVGGVRKSIYQSWLAKGIGLGLGLLCWGFKRVQEEIALFTSGQWHFHENNAPVHNSILVIDYLTTLPIVKTLLPVTFGYRYETIEEMEEAVTKVIDSLTQEDFDGAFQKLLERYMKCIAVGGDYCEGD